MNDDKHCPHTPHDEQPHVGHADDHERDHERDDLDADADEAAKVTARTSKIAPCV